MAATRKVTLSIESSVIEQLEIMASEEQRQLQEVAGEALRVYIALKRNPDLRPGVSSAFIQSQTEFDPLYKELAK